MADLQHQDSSINDTLVEITDNLIFLSQKVFPSFLFQFSGTSSTFQPNNYIP